MNDDRAAETTAALGAAGVPAPNPALRRLMETLSSLGATIAVMRAGSVSANICGTIAFGRDGADKNTLVLKECGCHMHVAWHDVEDFGLEAIDVGYGSEPTVVLRDRFGEAIVKFHFQPHQWSDVRATIAPVLLGQSVSAPLAARLAPIIVTSSMPRLGAGADVIFSVLERSGVSVAQGYAGDSAGRSHARPEDRFEWFEAVWNDASITHLWAALGGYGCTELLPLFKRRLGPSNGPKTFIGSSDVSLLGVWLASQFPSVTYLHAPNFQDELLLSSRREDIALLLELIKGLDTKTRTYRIGVQKTRPEHHSHVAGFAVPINLSAARSLSAMRDFRLPPRSVLFLEDINEDRARVARMVDDLSASDFFETSVAIVLGQFIHPGGETLDPTDLCELMHERTGLPVLNLGEFGHGYRRLPIVMSSPVTIDIFEGHCDLTLEFHRNQTLTRGSVKK
jgi:muramoyltetrapeptide carboxypeptidase